MLRKIAIAGLVLVSSGPVLSQPARPAIISVSHIAVYSSDLARAETF